MLRAIILGMRKLLLLALMTLPAWGADGTKLKVMVTNVEGKPVDRAAVVVKFGGRSIVRLGKNMRTSWEMRTGQDGAVEIPEMPKGKILVQIIAKGYQTFGDSFEVQEDQRTLEIKLTPPQKQYSAHEK